ncbi:VOC family protein [Streptomyces sulphureus]|uniref:VOC family protein n=1 Tax=Streptomyces sulphureus TaxID=47758 RepID=UPI00037BDA5B|nr:VOC family protein [Streptomyces sulphureus]
MVDCADAYGLAQFRSTVTGCPVHPGDPEVPLPLPEGPALVFIQVPEPKTVKNRLHPCLRPSASREEEVERLVASLVADRREPDSGWAVLSDLNASNYRF